MSGLKSLVGKKVALMDRQFVINEGRLVWPTTVGTLLAVEDDEFSVQLAGEDRPTVFFREGVRCVKEVLDAPAAEG
jgi:hypothetical protein